MRHCFSCTPNATRSHSPFQSLEALCQRIQVVAVICRRRRCVDRCGRGGRRVRQVILALNLLLGLRRRSTRNLLGLLHTAQRRRRRCRTRRLPAWRCQPRSSGSSARSLLGAPRSTARRISSGRIFGIFLSIAQGRERRQWNHGRNVRRLWRLHQEVPIHQTGRWGRGNVHLWTGGHHRWLWSPPSSLSLCCHQVRRRNRNDDRAPYSVLVPSDASLARQPFKALQLHARRRRSHRHELQNAPVDARGCGCSLCTGVTDKVSACLGQQLRAYRLQLRQLTAAAG